MRLSLVAERIASDYLEWFLRATRLHERGPEENDVLEALFPKDVWYPAVARAEQRVLELTWIVEPTSARDWQNALVPAVRNVQLFFFDEVRPAVDDQMRAWITDTQERIVEAVEQAIEALLDAAETGRKVICTGCLPQRYGKQFCIGGL